jgi:peptide/nickel transport system ATP-binding protein
MSESLPLRHIEGNTTLQAPLLSVKGLKTHFNVKGTGVLRAVDEIDLEVHRGEILGLVGESGCGKTVLSLSLLRLVPPPGRIAGGEIFWKGRNLVNLGSEEIRQVRGKEMAMIFQNAQASLNPVYSIRTQMRGVLQSHRRLSKKEIWDESIRLLRLVKIPDAEKRFNDFPHRLSAGMCQRIMIAMALLCQPQLLIADEPTASLDVTIQAQIMDLLLELRERFEMAILLVSHDLGVIARMCDRIAVMYLGRIVEMAPAIKLYSSPMHPYTQALLNSVPVPDPTRKGRLTRLEGDLPSPFEIPVGCRFRSRCPEAFDLCPQIDPGLQAVNGYDHLAACLLYNRTTEQEGSLTNTTKS